MARKHYVDEVIRSLSQKRDCKIISNKYGGGTIYILNGKSHKYPKSNDLGNGSWGKIDFLCNHKGFIFIYVSEFPKV